MTVRAGTTSSTTATDDLMCLEDANAFAVVAFTALTRIPKIRYKPTLDVPQSVEEDEVEGRVEILLQVDHEGRVQSISVVQSLHPDADAACVGALKKSRWKPGLKGDKPVAVKDVPYSCRFEMNQ